MNVVAQPAFLPVDWWALGPLLALTLGVLTLLLLELVPQRENGNRGGIVSLLTLAAAAWSALHVAHDKRLLFEGMFVHDPMTVFFTLLFCATIPASSQGPATRKPVAAMASAEPGSSTSPATCSATNRV